jgi:hypothetical protein
MITMVYLVAKNKCVIGVFTNRTWMMSTISHLTEKLHIKGVRKDVAVTASSIGTQMTSGYLPLYDDNNEIVMRIWKLNENTINPQFKENQDDQSR